MSEPNVASREEVLLSNMLAIQAQLPHNDFGMPEFIVRADMLPYDLESQPKERQWAFIEAAKVDLHYSDGFPVTSSGGLFWERLDHEGSGDFMLFQRYLEMVQTYGYRSTQLLAKSLVRDQVNERARAAIADANANAYIRNQAQAQAQAQSHDHADAQAAANANQIAVPVPPSPGGSDNIFIDMVESGNGNGSTKRRPPPVPKKLDKVEKGDGHSRVQAQADAQAAAIWDQESEQLMRATSDRLRQLYVLYFWKARAGAFDVVGEAAVRKIRAVRAIHLDERTFMRVNNMVEKVMQRFDSFDADDLERLEPEQAVKIMKELIHLQRVSVGLPAAAPADAHLPGVSDSNASTPIEDHLRTIANSRKGGAGDDLSALDDADTASMAQELAIRLMKGKK